MELLPLLFLSFCFLTLSGLTFGAESGPFPRKVIVKEDDDVILPCSIDTNENIESIQFDWKKEVPRKEVFMYTNGNHYNNGLPGQDAEFKDRVSHFQEELKHGNASIRIKKARRADKGNYTCIFPHKKNFSIELVVEPILKDRIPENIPGAVPEPYVTMLEKKGHIRCKVPGASFNTTLEWLDSDNKTLSSETLEDKQEQGLFYVTIHTTAPEPGCYRCVATQMEISHQIPSSQICVPDEPNTDWKIGAGVAVAAGVAIVVGILVWLLKHKKKEPSEPSAQEQKLNAGQSEHV